MHIIIVVMCKGAVGSYRHDMRIEMVRLEKGKGIGVQDVWDKGQNIDPMMVVSPH